MAFGSGIAPVPPGGSKCRPIRLICFSPNKSKSPAGAFCFDLIFLSPLKGGEKIKSKSDQNALGEF